MTRISIMVVAGGLALLVFVALFYVTGVALGIAAIGLLVIAAIAAAIYGAIKWNGRSRSAKP